MTRCKKHSMMPHEIESVRRKQFSGSMVAHRLAWSSVQLLRNGLELRRSVSAQIGTLGQVPLQGSGEAILQSMGEQRDEEPVKKVVKMLRRHEQGLLSFSQHRISNACAEGFNSAIQLIKANVRGFRNFTNYRARILFHCGKLDLTMSYE